MKKTTDIILAPAASPEPVGLWICEPLRLASCLSPSRSLRSM